MTNLIRGRNDPHDVLVRLQSVTVKVGPTSQGVKATPEIEDIRQGVTNDLFQMIRHCLNYSFIQPYNKVALNSIKLTLGLYMK